MNRLNILVERLREAGYRLTPQRMAILKILLEGINHPTAEEVYAQVKPIFPMTSLATVYKTVALLKEMNEIREINLGDRGSRYDGNNTIPHAHLICVQCNQIIDSNPVDIQQLSDGLAAATGYKMISQRLDFFGVCPDCQSVIPPQI